MLELFTFFYALVLRESDAPSVCTIIWPGFNMRQKQGLLSEVMALAVHDFAFALPAHRIRVAYAQKEDNQKNNSSNSQVSTLQYSIDLYHVCGFYPPDI